MKKALTIENLKERIGKPVFVIPTTEEFKERTAWHVVSKINEFKADSERHGYIEFTDYDYIDLEKIQFFRFFDAEVSATELKEILDAEEKEKKKTGYEVVDEDSVYCYITECLTTSKALYAENDIKNTEKAIVGNHFNDEKLTENIARAERLRYQLRRFAALNGGIPLQKDWKNSRVAKYELIGESDNFIHATKNFESRAIGAVYFKDIEACEKAMVIFKDELIWYFTEFEEMLH